MNDLWGQIEKCMQLLDKALKESSERGSKCVNAEAEYYTQKAETAFELMKDGHSASMIALVIKGDSRVAAKMKVFKQSSVEYENAREARNIYKKKLDTLREQYQREWSQSGMKD